MLAVFPGTRLVGRIHDTAISLIVPSKSYLSVCCGELLIPRPHIP